MGKILAVLALIVILAGGFFFLSQKGKLSQSQKNTPTTAPAVTSQNVDSTLNEQAATIDSTLTQVDQDFKEIDQADQSESDLQGL